MLLFVFAKYQDVVYLAEYSVQLVEDGAHQSLEVLRCACNSEWELLKQYFPTGVINVVRRREADERGICQNPLFASSLLNKRAPVSWASVSSTFGNGWMSRRTLVLKGLRSIQMRTAPFFLGTTTITAHHSVGSSTFEITPISSIRLSSSMTFALRGMGTCRGVQTH